MKYVVLSHAHGDHDGGAKLLQDTFAGVHLVYGAEDWDAIDKAATHMGGKPKRDVTGDDGMTISIGDASMRIVTMPGHTPGTLSYLFEIRDGGKPLRVAYVGGTAIPFNATAQYYDTYMASSRKMAKAAADYGATALITNHTEFDNAFYKAHTAADRRNGGSRIRSMSAPTRWPAILPWFRIVRLLPSCGQRENRFEHAPQKSRDHRGRRYTKDPFLTTNMQLDEQALTRLGITRNFNEGDHGNPACFAAKVLPFFSLNLAAGKFGDPA